MELDGIIEFYFKASIPFHAFHASVTEMQINSHSHH